MGELVGKAGRRRSVVLVVLPVFGRGPLLVSAVSCVRAGRQQEAQLAVFHELVLEHHRETGAQEDLQARTDESTNMRCAEDASLLRRP